MEPGGQPSTGDKVGSDERDRIRRRADVSFVVSPERTGRGFESMFLEPESRSSEEPGLSFRTQERVCPAAGPVHARKRAERTSRERFSGDAYLEILPRANLPEMFTPPRKTTVSSTMRSLRWVRRNQ